MGVAGIHRSASTVRRLVPQRGGDNCLCRSGAAIQPTCGAGRVGGSCIRFIKRFDGATLGEHIKLFAGHSYTSALGPAIARNHACRRSRHNFLVLLSRRGQRGIGSAMDTSNEPTPVGVSIRELVESLGSVLVRHLFRSRGRVLPRLLGPARDPRHDLSADGLTACPSVGSFTSSARSSVS